MLNIFILDENMTKSAEYYMDAHVRKIILEIAQMLCIAHNVTGGEAPYKTKGYINHPISKWIRENKSNYRWAVKMGLTICGEYTYRYGKIHKTQAILEWLRDNEPNIPDGNIRPFVQAVASDCKVNDAIIAYRDYYNRYKRHLAKWKNRPVPEWYI